MVPLATPQRAALSRTAAATPESPPSVATFPPWEPQEMDALTPREREVLGLIARGMSNDELAGELYMSPLTAKTHVSRILSLQ
jgi:DNA-binding NarL/FixJ family response regulator